ncbi:MAG: hypothetical protein Q4F14_05075 [Bacillota bacterium]|nr:hypothetical protein [Bacillota bacterium]
MKPKTLVKRLSATLLATTMAASSFSQFAIPVFAQDTTRALSKEQFATAEQLKSFDTNNQNGRNPAKIYFGKNNQQWWIAGSQNGNLTLFAASPLLSDVQFNSTTNEEIYEGKNVNPNHYGASDIKKTVKDLETSYFTGAEQDLMNETTVYTDDTKNNTVYSTTDKLYLAYGDFTKGTHVMAGENDPDNLNGALRIDEDYKGPLNNKSFWLRSPSSIDSICAQVAQRDYMSGYFPVTNKCDLLPAFELNLSNMLFGSAAPAASATGNLTLQWTAGSGAFTLRYDASKHNQDLGSALVSYDKSKVTLTSVSVGKDIYLVAQNNSGAKAKLITNETEVLATDMGLKSFADCEVWLETTDATNRMTYATLATDSKGFNIKVQKGEGLTVTNAEQAEVSGEINPIKVEVTDGYYLPNNYKDTIQGLNGLTVKDVTQDGLTIAGTPTSDVNIQLPAATLKPVSGGGGSATVKLNPVYRAYNPNNGEHLYTVDENEYKHVTSVGWDAEGVAFMAEEEKNGQALYRVYNPNSGLHHYTLDEKEKNTLVLLGWRDEKVAWYTSKKPQSAPVFRVYNPNDGNHHYTTNKQEKDVLVSYGWQDEGLAFRTAPIEK